MTMIEIDAENYPALRNHLKARSAGLPAAAKQRLADLPDSDRGDWTAIQEIRSWVHKNLSKKERLELFFEFYKEQIGEGTTIDQPTSTDPEAIERAKAFGGSSPNRLEVTFTFELEEKIGRGSMGEVYRARMHSNHLGSETVAVKILNPDLVSYGSGEDHLAYTPENREINILSELNGHPNIVAFKGSNIIDNGPEKKATIFFVMEHVKGFDLNGFKALHGLSTKMLASGKAAKIPSGLIGLILFKAANALDYANNLAFSDGSNGIVHLDISPGNILINQSLGLIKLSDFGVAARMEEILETSKPWAFVGKPRYVSPEIVNEGHVSFAADFYSLGVIMYELLTGVSPNRFYQEDGPITRQNVREALRRIHGERLIPPHEIVRGVDERLSEIAMTLMEYDPEDRFVSAMKLRETLGQSIYNKGYGPTEGSLAHYIRQLLLAQRHVNAKNEDGDPLTREYMDYLIANREPCQLFKDARKRLLSGNNPCRVSRFPS